MSDKTAEELRNELTEMTITAVEWRKKCEGMEEKYSEKDLEHKSLIREIQTICGVDKLPPAPQGTGVNERALVVIGNALASKDKELSTLKEENKELIRKGENLCCKTGTLLMELSNLKAENKRLKKEPVNHNRTSDPGVDFNSLR